MSWQPDVLKGPPQPCSVGGPVGTSAKLNNKADCCRLCGGVVEKQFSLTVLGRHNVWYSRCLRCASLQTEEPYWLAEAYANPLAASDVGAARRCLMCRAVVWVVLRFLRLKEPRILDFGGGSGLLCRLLRDIGFDAWMWDQYGTGEYAQDFRVNFDAVAPGSYDVVTAFEVLEHFPNPSEGLNRLFDLSPKALIVSTDPYLSSYDENWWYISPASGQHVFLYSPRALEMVADHFGYSLLSVGGWHVFSRRPQGTVSSKALGWALSGQCLNFCRIVVEMIPTQINIERDHRVSLQKAGSLSTLGGGRA